MWKNLETLNNIYDNVEQIHLSLRDFKVYLSTKKITEENNESLFNLLNSNIKSDYLINRDEIINFILNIKSISTDKEFIRFNGVNFECHTNYLRLYHYKDNNFIVCNSDNIIIEYKGCVYSNIKND